MDDKDYDSTADDKLEIDEDDDEDSDEEDEDESGVADESE